MLKEFLNNIANSLRSKLGTTDTINAQDFPDKISEVYEAGQKKEQALYWDAVTLNGNRTDYSYAFTGTRHTKESMKPTHDIRPTNANSMFYFCKNNGQNTFSMTEVEKECGIVFDFSNCTNFNQAFNASCFNEINVLDVSKATNTYQAIYNGSSSSKLHRINRMIFSEDTVIQWGLFGHCSELTYVGFEGVIAQSIDLKYSPLEVESAIKFIKCLKDYSGTDKEYTYTVLFTSETMKALNTLSAEEASELFDGKNWMNYTLDKGWDIA